MFKAKLRITVQEFNWLDQHTDADWLREASSLEINKLADAALSANGFSDKDVEELEKN